MIALLILVIVGLMIVILYLLEPWLNTRTTAATPKAYYNQQLHYQKEIMRNGLYLLRDIPRVEE